MLPAIYRVSLFGRFRLMGPEGQVDLSNKKLAGLLAYLACTDPQPQSRDHLTALLWGSHFETQAQQNLRQALFRLRRILGHDVLKSDNDRVWLDPGTVECDVRRLERLGSEQNPVALATAGALYRGPLLTDLNISEEAWLDWLTAERPRLERLALDIMVRHANQSLKAGNAEEALKTAQRAIALNGLREDAHRVVVQTLISTGRKAEALKHYDGLVALLKRELNTAPDKVTRALVSELRD